MSTNHSQLGTLYVCATPIGNLSDASFRLIDTLKTVDIIYAEDTRVTKRLLQHYDISKPVYSLQKYTEDKQVNGIKKNLLEGLNLALVSDAGTPNIADPGAHLLTQLHKESFPIVPLPGPSAITTLISVSGILCNQFTFLGFLPKKENDKIRAFNKCIEFPIVFFESAKRLNATLKTLDIHYPVKEICLGKELSKKFETVFTGSIDEFKSSIKDSEIKGEWVVIVTFNLKALKLDYENKTIEALKEARLSMKQTKVVAKLLNISANKANK
ncbi:16S rRNA (cytidine(1402)-2'-O)-methyltransferase [Candidatus Marinamargulisbacteria bacterium SCGC AAA071-K20]|nr:16S rRNA (cytidine(1402)-2'-O)-methyltransferase [Candidatus Marinamargulisbacteria bacterium SCGC AAA071-K20]